MSYNVVESTSSYGAKCMSFQATADIENGMLISKGSLVAGETDIYVAGVPTTSTEVYLVDTPAWSYDDNKATDQNEENFINKAGIPFRGRQLKKDNKFTTYSTGITPISTTSGSGESAVTTETALAKGQYVTIDGTTNKPKAVATAPSTGFYGVITDIKDLGFPYCVGSAGTSVTIGSTNMGYAIDTRVSKVTIEVVKNV